MTEPVVSTPGVQVLVAGLADNKLFLGRRYAEWCTAAPSLEAAVAAAAMAQDEIGHARSLYPLLKDVAGASSEVEPETRTTFTNARFLDRPFGSWLDFVAANFLFDTAISILLDAAQDSTLIGLAQRAKRILEEERLHWLHGEGWTRRLATEGQAVREELTSAFSGVLPCALDMLSLASPALVEERVLSADADALRERYRSCINPILSAVSLPPA